MQEDACSAAESQEYGPYNGYDDTPPSVDMQLRMMGRQCGISPLHVASAFMRLTFASGRVSFADFVELRLFDRAFHAGAVLERFVGWRKNREICAAVNARRDRHGVISDKVASTACLQAYGLPTIPITAVYAAGKVPRSARLLSDRAAVADFLTSRDAYPLLGKPVGGTQSLGAIALRRCLPCGTMLETIDGTRVSLEKCLSQIERHAAAGYMFQPLVRPHAKLAALCGERLSCVRVLTALTEGGPEILAVALKIPAGGDSGYSDWRSGDLLAEIDGATGAILRATSGCGLATREPVRHPDSGVDLAGFVVPHWREVRALALEGACSMAEVPLIGWDIGCAEGGPLIVAMNETPDFFLTQFANRRGILDAKFEAFVAFRKREVARKTAVVQKTLSMMELSQAEIV